MDQNSNKRTKIGSMNYNSDGKVVINETGKLILPIGDFRDTLFKWPQYDESVHQIDLKATSGFTAMLIRMADQIDEGIIPEDVRYAVYDTKTKQMDLYHSIEIGPTRGRLKISNVDHIYMYLMRKFDGTVQLGNKWVRYFDDDRYRRDKVRNIMAKDILQEYFTGGKSGKETRAIKRGRSM